MKTRSLLGLLATSSLIAWSPAMAQTTTTAEPQAEETADGDQIIITATRRSEALSDVPIAVSAVTGDTLARTGATDVRALGQVAPSLLVSGATSEVNFSARIRGIGTVGENAGLESSVGLFIDGVYRSRTGVGLSELGEIERVEVLRGPQGTLFGRNSTAGLINIVTKGPSLSDGFSGNASATYGNYNFWRLDGAVNVPLGETAAARIKMMCDTEDGFLIAEKDLELRGGGEVLGARQSGAPEFRIADVPNFSELLGAARDDATNVLTKDPGLISPRGQALRTLLYLFECDEAVRLFRAA